MEIWSEIKGYEGLYEVSSYGRVKSKKGKEKILKGSCNTSGYYQVTLCNDNGNKFYLVHRLVAEAFLDNPNNLPIVNHKDEVCYHNFVENLEWCDAKYNINYGTRTRRMIESQNEIYDLVANTKDKRIRGVIQYDKKGKKVKKYESIMEAERSTGVWHTSIVNCCKHKVKSAGGFIWKYVKEDLS